MPGEAVRPLLGWSWKSRLAMTPVALLRLGPVAVGAVVPRASGRPLVLDMALGASLPRGPPVVWLGMPLPWLPGRAPVAFVATVGEFRLGFRQALEG